MARGRSGPRLFRGPHRGRRLAAGPRPLPQGAVRSPGLRGRRRLARAGDRAREPHRLRPDRRAVLAGSGRDRRVPGARPGRCRLREPARGGDHRRLAGRAALRGLEGQRLVRQELGRPLLRAAVPARAEPDGHALVAVRAPEPLVFRRALGRDLPTVERGEGAVLWDRRGKRYLDGSGGAVVVNVGHGRAEVAQAMSRQAAAAAYVHATQFTSDALEEYARRLAPHAPGDCRRLYLVSGGSEANETAVKLARAYHVATGAPSRHKVIRRSVSYHGSTLATLALSGR